MATHAGADRGQGVRGSGRWRSTGARVEMISVMVPSLSGMPAMPLLAAHPYASILILVVAMMATAGLIMVLTHVVGPKRSGPVKDDTYEAGMPAIGDARRRFNVQFYLYALLFLLFDVEIVFLWPWAPLFHDAGVKGEPVVVGGESYDKAYLVGAVVVFVAILLVGYVYAWRRKAFQLSK